MDYTSEGGTVEMERSELSLNPTSRRTGESGLNLNNRAARGYKRFDSCLQARQIVLVYRSTSGTGTAL